MILAGLELCAVAPPKGSITIDGIADIKYPTEQTWSPDSKTVAFLWDAAGKQDLYIARPGEQPVALTDFPMNPDRGARTLGTTSADCRPHSLQSRRRFMVRLHSRSEADARSAL